MSASLTRKVTKTPGSTRKSKSLTKRQTGTLFKTISKDVKSLIEQKDYADYLEKLKKWKFLIRFVTIYR